MSDPNTAPNTEATETAPAEGMPAPTTAVPVSKNPYAGETRELSIARILKAPLTWPAFDRHEAVFRGRAEVEIVRGKLAKSDTGKDMIWLEGVVVSTCKLAGPPSQYPASNPEGWDMNAFGETKVEVALKDEEGNPVLDESGKPRVAQKYPPLGPIDVTGFRFVYGGELTRNEDGSFFWKTEQLINNLRFLGWKPGRALAPRTGELLTDFVPNDGEDYVSAEALGITGKFIAHFELEEVKEDSKFAPRILLVNFKLIDARVTKSEALSLNEKFGALLSATRDGTRYDGRKIAEREAKKTTTGNKAGGAVTGKGSATAVAADAARVAGTPPELCGKPVGPDKMPCKEKPGHAGACIPMPF